MQGPLVQILVVIQKNKNKETNVMQGRMVQSSLFLKK
jgi:hypothetical protein